MRLRADQSTSAVRFAMVASVAAAATTNFVAAQAEPPPAARASDTSDPVTRSTRKSIDGASLGGFVLPSAPVDGRCTIAATRGWRWKTDDTQRLMLDGDVRIRLSGYNFSARRAVVWINRLPLRTPAAESTTSASAESVVTQIAIWFERADEPTRRAGLGASGRDLLVTATLRGTVDLSLVVAEEGAPTDAAFVARGEARLAGFLRGLEQKIAEGSATLATGPGRDSPTTPVERDPQPGGKLLAAAAATPVLPDSIQVAAPNVGALPIFQPDGTLSFSADSIVIDEKRDHIAVQGMVELEYLAAIGGTDRKLQLSAERGVIFLAPGALQSLREGSRTIDASLLQGIYLEGAVQASDGDYALRGAQVYYDLATNRAAIVDAVLRTYDRRRSDLPIYTRAAELRQVAADQWTAERATISTSEFFTPHLSIGVERVTVTERPALADDPSTGGTYLNAENASVQFFGTPVVPLPGYEGRLETIPLRSVAAGYDQGKGAEFSTDWDLMSLIGAAPIAGLDAELSVDGYSERGPGVGTTFALGGDLGSGVIDLYGLYDFGGDDRTSSGLDVTVDAGPRGIVDAAWQTALSADFTLQTQLAAISDETFVTAWREDDFDNRREYETSVFINGITDNTALSLLAKYDLNDFISNSYLLASRSYVVDKLPELSYRRYGDEAFEGFSWTQQWSANAMSLQPTSGTPNSLGVPIGAWGNVIAPNQDVNSVFETAGYSDNIVSRFDTRHELSLPLADQTGTFSPFVTGRATGYLLDEFNLYSADAENLRFQAGGGVRGSLRYLRVDDSVQSRLFDLNRMRHIVEPYGTLWAGWDSLPEGALPIYDQDVEGTTGGAAANIGLRNTLQTQRGGSGAWQSVDWVRLDTGVVFNDGGSDFTQQPVNPLDPASSLRWAQSPIPAFYSFRPDFSQWGSHVYGLSTWEMSDSLTVGGTAKYLFEDTPFVTDPDSALENLAMGSLGIEMRHDPVTSTYLEYRYIAPTSSELLQAGFLYRAGKRYLIAFSPQYDIEAAEMRAVSGSIARTFPDFNLNLNVGYDLIEDNTFVSMSLSIPANTNNNQFGNYNPAAGAFR